MKKVISVINDFLVQTPRWTDALILCVFTILITIHPYYLNDRINLFELGLYLPGINGILHGLVPYRDFFHLRGPLELYVPVWLMQIFGTHIGVLCAYFFFGNVLCLIMLVLIGKELLRSRYMLYLMVPVIIARAYPRVCFMIWGGMRYAMGLVIVFCLIKFFKSKKSLWIILAGFASALAGLISIEMGVYGSAAVLIGLTASGLFRLITWAEIRRNILYFIGAGLLGIAPWILYSLQQHAFIPYVDSFWTIVTRMQVVIDPHLVSIYPHNFAEAAASMINVHSINFKQMTPAWLYVFLLGYLIVRAVKGSWTTFDLCLLSLGIYGFIMYNTGFRGLWAAQFEMALMPEKLLYFFLVEGALIWAWHKTASAQFWQRTALSLLIIGLFVSSWSYAISRYNHRFWAYQYVGSIFNAKNKKHILYRDKRENYGQLTIDRIRGIWVPLDQEKDLIQLDQLIKERTKPEDTIVMFPELGIYNFIFDRPFLGRFPIPTFSWFNEHWFDEYMAQLKEGKTKYIIVQKKMPTDWYQVYLGYAPSKLKYEQMLDLIHRNYKVVAQTDKTEFYERL